MQCTRYVAWRSENPPLVLPSSAIFPIGELLFIIENGPSFQDCLVINSIQVTQRAFPDALFGNYKQQQPDTTYVNRFHNAERTWKKTTAECIYMISSGHSALFLPTLLLKKRKLHGIRAYCTSFIYKSIEQIGSFWQFFSIKCKTIFTLKTLQRVC